MTLLTHVKFVVAVTRRLVAARSSRCQASGRPCSQFAFGIPCAPIRLEPRLNREGVSE